MHKHLVCNTKFGRGEFFSEMIAKAGGWV